MKALTLWQPWATLIALGLKEYETRHWVTSYRGPLAIHAAKRAVHPEEINPTIRRVLDEHGLTLDSLPLGAVVCIVDVVQMRRTEDAIHDLKSDELHFGNYTAGRFAWRLANVRRFEPPIPAKGAQGIWAWHRPPGA